MLMAEEGSCAMVEGFRTVQEPGDFRQPPSGFETGSLFLARFPRCNRFTP
jgi:hypothetical protein